MAYTSGLSLTKVVVAVIPLLQVLSVIAIAIIPFAAKKPMIKLAMAEIISNTVNPLPRSIIGFCRKGGFMIDNPVKAFCKYFIIS
ncbi:MAG: hypothetical protein DCC43_14725 [Candidatus Brocadia sp.]|nr:hypothetical protein [Candidatus Brocadia sp.]MCE7912320.1 hypothetical protein [Candidatus Brocadia sp. AMX3]OQZ03316.1 MAG: hypothetical protein B6D35_00055 [Candidatus Brocadia sp. UTAMX2]RIJ90634.1 MAG: hypothetical protein DCC43_14725 [Candidatus Brocadia sp.]